MSKAKSGFSLRKKIDNAGRHLHSLFSSEPQPRQLPSRPQRPSSRDSIPPAAGPIGNANPSNLNQPPSLSAAAPAGRSNTTSSPVAHSQGRFADNVGQSSPTKEKLRIAWHGVEQLLQRVEKCLGGTPFKPAFSALNTLIDVKNAVIDNDDAIEQQFIEITERLDVVNTALVKAESDAARARFVAFSKKLVNEIEVLDRMMSRSTFVKVLENAEDKLVIQESLKRIDGYTKDLQLDIVITIERNTDDIQESLFQLRLDSWPRSRKAAYNAELGEEATMTREGCTEGTRVDILDNIRRWAVNNSSDSPAIFWLTGQAGSGKSTIAYTVAKHFDASEEVEDGADTHSKDNKSSLSTVLGADFFCSRQFGETRRRENIIPTIVYHLARQCRSYALALRKANKFDSVSTVSRQIRDLLVHPWRQSGGERSPSIPPYLIVIDALDEIDGQGGSEFLRDLLKEVDSGRLQGLKFLVTSRPDPEVAKLCSSFDSDAVCHLYEVPRDTVRDDIMKYLEAKIPELEGEPQLSELAEKADGLFIYAATVVRYIAPRPDMTKGEHLDLMKELLDLGFAQHTGSLIDMLYQQILWIAFRALRPNLLYNRLKILHTLLCTEERISTTVIAKLLSDDADMRLAELVVRSLHAILYIKNDKVLWYHASFLDFMFDETRSKFIVPGTINSPIDMSCNADTLHDFLTRSCFRIMTSELRFNICHLPSSFLLDVEVPDLSRRVEDNISDVLRYACQYWARHLGRAITDSQNFLRNYVNDFLRLQVLFWIEAMNLLGLHGQCNILLQQARKWVLKSDQGTLSDLARDLNEAANFATYFSGSPAAQSTPHLYMSSLATWSAGSGVSHTWKYHFPGAPRFERTKGARPLPLMTIQMEYPAWCLALSNDGTRVVSGSDDTSVRVWDASTGAEIITLNGHTEPVRSVAFSNDGTLIVSGSFDKTVRVWNASTGAEVATLNGHTDAVFSVAFSNDGTRIVSGSDDKTVRVWDASTSAEVTTLNGHTGTVFSVAFSNDGTRIVSGSDDQSVRVWDVSTGAEVTSLDGHTDAISSVAFSNDGTCIVSGSIDKSVRVWDTSSGAEVTILNGHTDAVSSVAFSNDGIRIVSGSDDKSVRVWVTSTGAEVTTLNGHIGPVFSVAFSDDGTRIVSGSDDRSVRVWDASTSVEITMLNGHTEPVRSVAFSNDGTHIVSGSDDKTVRVWDASTGSEAKTFHGHTSSVSSVAFSNDGICIVSGSIDRSVRVWNASMGVEVTMLNGHTHWVNSVAFSSDGTRIVSGSNDKTVRVWDASTNAEVTMLNGHTEPVRSVAFSNDGAHIVSGSSDNSVRVWDASTGAEVTTLNGHSGPVSSVAFSNDGTHIVSGSDDESVKVWDASTGAEVTTLNGHTGAIFAVAFSNDGTRIVSGSDDKTVRVWDASTGTKVATFNGHTSSVSSVAFSDDGTRIVSGSNDKSVRVWDVTARASHWEPTLGGWIFVESGQRLIWVPPAIMDVLLSPHNSLLISSDGLARLDYAQSKLGIDWADSFQFHVR